MGALTLKSFPFELRGWELEKINSIDLTDSFGSTIKVSLNNKQIIQIEPATLNDSICQCTQLSRLKLPKKLILIYVTYHNFT